MKEYGEFLNNEVRNLQDYADLDGTELGEYCQALIELQRFEYMMPKELVKKLRLEIESRLYWYRDNSRIITREETMARNVRSLQFFDE